jgi:hypothetical protein
MLLPYVCIAMHFPLNMLHFNVHFFPCCPLFVAPPPQQGRLGPPGTATTVVDLPDDSTMTHVALTYTVHKACHQSSHSCRCVASCSSQT